MWQLYVAYIYFVVILELMMDTAECEIRLLKKCCFCMCVCVCVCACVHVCFDFTATEFILIIIYYCSIR